MSDFDIVSRDLYSLPLSKRKYESLLELARRLGVLRTEFRHRFGGIPKKLNDRKIRDEYLASGREFNVPARIWKETLRDTLDDLNAYNEAGFKKVIKKLYSKFGKQEAVSLSKTIRNSEYLNDRYVHRLIRKSIKRSYNKCHNQIVLDNCTYTAFIKDDKAFIKICSLDKGKRIVIPLRTNRIPSGTIRLVVDHKSRTLRVIHSVKVYSEHQSSQDLGIVGIDKGYSEVLTDNLGNRYGKTFGIKLSELSDYVTNKYRGRNRMSALYKLSIERGNFKKAKNILKNNLGTKKVSKRKDVLKAEIKREINLASKEICSKAQEITLEDLSHSFSYDKGAKANRNLSQWTRGLIDEALNKYAKRYGVPLFYVNAAYTSQTDCVDYSLSGVRRGNEFYRESGEVLDADVNAANNILTRRYDREITLYHSPKKVKEILSRRSLETAQAVLQLRYADNEERVAKRELSNNLKHSLARSS